MSNLHVRFKAYDSAGVFQGFLTPSSWSASVQHNDAGTLSMTYPRVSLNGGILQCGLEQGLEIGMEVAAHDGTWVEPYNCRFLLVSRSRDAKDGTDTVTLNCMTWIWLTKKILNLNMRALLTDTDNKGKRPFYSATSGMIVHTLLDENRTRGGAATVMPAGFNSARDTNGDTWAYKMTLYYDAGVDLYTVIDNLSANGMCDWRTDGRMLKLWNADSSALCRDLSSRVRIPLATGLLESPEEETIEGLAGNILVRGDNDLVFTQENPAAPTPWGRWELYSSQGGVSNKGTAQLMMQTQLASAARVRGQYTRQILTTGIEHLPLVDYRPGDWITAPTVSHGEKVRVQRVELSNRNDGGVKCALMLNDRLYDAQTRQAKRIQGITGGAVAGGAQGGRPEAERDHRVPKAPQGVVVQTDAYLDANGYQKGLATVGWGAVGQATNNTSIEISSYDVYWRPYINGERWRYAGSTNALTLSFGSLDCGTTIAVRVRAIPSYSDQKGEWSGEVTALVASDTTPPSVPSKPTLASELGVVTIHWDGRTATGTHMEPDFDHIEVGRGTNPNNLTRIAATQSGEGDCLDTALIAGSQPVYALRAVDHAGNTSAWSATATITVASTVSPEEINQIKNELKTNNDALDQANKDISQANRDLAAAKEDIKKNHDAISTAKDDIKKNNAALATANQTLTQANKDIEQAKKDIQSNSQTIAGTKEDLAAAKDDIKTNSQTIAGTKEDLKATNKTLEETNKTLTQANQTLTQASNDLAQAKKDIKANADKAKDAYDNAVNAQATADGKNKIIKSIAEPPHDKLTAGDLWYQTSLLTQWEGEPNNSPSLLTDLATQWEGEPNNSPSLLIDLNTRVDSVHMYDGTQFNDYNLVASNVIASNSITTPLLAAGSIIADKLAANAVTADKILAGAIIADKIAANAVTANKLAANAVTADKIAANAVTAGKVAAEAITAREIKALAISTDKLAANAVTAEKIKAGSIIADKLAANAVSTDKLAANAVTAEKITANAVVSDKIAANAVTVGKLAANSVNADKLAANAVTTAKIAALAVNADKLAANAVTAEKITANAVVSDKIATNAVTTAKIAALAVNADKIAANAVTAEKIKALAITADKIAANTITTDKIKAGQFAGYVFTGSVYQSHTEDNKGFKLRGNSFDMWDARQNNTVHLDGSGTSNRIVGELDTKLSGDRVRIRPSFYTSTVGSDATQQGAGIDFPLQGTYARIPYIATESLDSKKGLISTLTMNSGMRTDGSAGAGTGFGAFFRLGQTRDSNNREMACAFLTANCDYLNLSQDTNRRQWRTYIDLTTISGEGTNAYITARKPGGYAACNLVGGDGRDTRAAIVAGDGNGEVGMECNINTGYLYLGGFIGGITGRASFVGNYVEGTNNLKPWSSMMWTIALAAPKYGRYKTVAALNNGNANAYLVGTPCNEKSGSFQFCIRTMPEKLSNVTNKTDYTLYPSGGSNYWITALSYLIKS